MADKDADFDEWLDDTGDTADDLSQDHIDELLGAVGTDKSSQKASATEKDSGELDQDNIDALLGLSADDSSSQATGEDQAMTELDQDNIDALLSGNASADSGAHAGGQDDDSLEQDNIDALLSGTGYDTEAADDFSLDELDQDNIDALLSSAEGESGPDLDELPELAQDNIDALLDEADLSAESAVEGLDELDQSDIDALLSSNSSAAAEPDELDELFAGNSVEKVVPPEESPTDDLGELDQNNFDALPTKTTQEEENTPDVQEQEPAPPEEDPELSTEEADNIAESAFESELDEMDQLFANIDSDAGDDDPFQAEEIDFAEMLGETEGDDQEFIELEADDGPQAAGDDDEFMKQAGAEDDNELEALMTEGEKGPTKKALVIPAPLAEINKGVLTGIVGGVIVLLLIGSFFLFSGSDEVIETNNVKRVATVEQTPGRKMAENFIPTTEDASYAMGSKGGELAIELTAADQDKQPLLYEITAQPLHGRLSGTAPMLTYLPDSTFAGEDRFEFIVNDGTDSSSVAVVTITGPDLAAMAKKETEKKKEKAKKKILKPQKPKVLAKDVKYFTISTGAVTIDWGRLWQEANSSPYVPQAVHVEIVGKAAKGSLVKHNRTSHIYTPDPFEAATDTIRYRFKKGGFRSATKTVTIDIELGSPAPEINFANLADGYLVGQNVVIDASGSRDEARQSLQFFWEQVAGVELDLHPINKEGSQVAFTMPSSFYTDPNPGPTLAVTAVDKTGKETRKEIKIKALSRRQTALWRGEKGRLSPDPPMEGSYFPWPFDD
ncbi:MAG: Ig-like domain-containing protein [Thermodesulfobacteriota bacterium]